MPHGRYNQIDLRMRLDGASIGHHRVKVLLVQIIAPNKKMYFVRRMQSVKEKVEEVGLAHWLHLPFHVHSHKNVVIARFRHSAQHSRYCFLFAISLPSPRDKIVVSFVRYRSLGQIHLLWVELYSITASSAHDESRSLTFQSLT